MMEAAVEEQRRAGRNRQLTERDRELCGFLAVCRYLTREQIERLMFPGRSKARSSTRLRQLAAKMGGQAAVVRGDLDAKKATATMAKLDRYGTFLCAPAGNVLADKRETFYTRAFKDGWRPKVLFVSSSEARRQSIADVIEERASSDKYKVPAKSLTLAEAHLYLCRRLYGADRPAGTVQPKPMPAMSPARPATKSRETAPSAAEERLRRGRVSVRGERLVNFERVLRTCVASLTSAQKTLEFYRVSREALPKAPADASEVLRIAGEYACRGQCALLRHNLSAAD